MIGARLPATRADDKRALLGEVDSHSDAGRGAERAVRADRSQGGATGGAGVAGAGHGLAAGRAAKCSNTATELRTAPSTFSSPAL